MTIRRRIARRGLTPDELDGFNDDLGRVGARGDVTLTDWDQVVRGGLYDVEIWAEGDADVVEDLQHRAHIGLRLVDHTPQAEPPSCAGSSRDG